MINVMYCGNQKVMDGIFISLLSMVKKTKEEINCHVLTMDLSDLDDSFQPINDEFIIHLNKMVKEYNSSSIVKKYDLTDIFKDEMINTPNLRNFYTPYALLRLFADKIDLPKKIIYLDTDTIINQDIKELYEIDVTDHEFAGVKDFLGRFFIDKNYINTGVLLLNLEMIKKTDLFTKTRTTILNKKMSFPDQTALNINATKKMFLPFKYNEQHKLKKDTVIQHFCKSIRLFPFYHTINVKPWHVDDLHKKLKITHYDDVLEEYLVKKESIGF